MLSLQDEYGPNGICFGCGPKNKIGLQIKSLWEGEFCVLRYRVTREEHQAFRGVVNGGIVGALFDCHLNWTAASVIHRQQPKEEFPSTVTSEISVKFKRPTPWGVDLLIKARPVETLADRSTVEGEMFANGKTTAISKGTFISVKLGHPAYHRWQ